MRKSIVAGNWKMNKNLEETETLLSEISAKCPDTESEVIVAPPFTSLAAAVRQLKSSSIRVAAQNMHFEENGAFTGEVSAAMLTGVGVQHVILGHSERRSYFGEDGGILHKKVRTALRHQLKVIYCFGELLEERKAGRQEVVVSEQLESVLSGLDSSDWEQIILAYEPVWAIGTGETASPEQAQEMHSFVRSWLRSHIGDSLAEGVRILYGGSVKPENAAEIFKGSDVDGGLIGGASLKADDFVEIIRSLP